MILFLLLGFFAVVPADAYEGCDDAMERAGRSLRLVGDWDYPRTQPGGISKIRQIFTLSEDLRRVRTLCGEHQMNPYSYFCAEADRALDAEYHRALEGPTDVWEKNVVFAWGVLKAVCDDMKPRNITCEEAKKRFRITIDVYCGTKEHTDPAVDCTTAGDAAAGLVIQACAPVEPIRPGPARQLLFTAGSDATPDIFAFQ